MSFLETVARRARGDGAVVRPLSRALYGARGIEPEADAAPDDVQPPPALTATPQRAGGRTKRERSRRARPPAATEPGENAPSRSVHEQAAQPPADGPRPSSRLAERTGGEEAPAATSTPGPEPARRAAPLARPPAAGRSSVEPQASRSVVAARRTVAPGVLPQPAARRPSRPDHAAPAITHVVRGGPESAGPAPIHVSIGRVEVRATAPAPAPAPPAIREPRQSLDDFLGARDAGRAP